VPYNKDNSKLISFVTGMAQTAEERYKVRVQGVWK
jgi:hypothetical protein